VGLFGRPNCVPQVTESLECVQDLCRPFFYSKENYFSTCNVVPFFLSQRNIFFARVFVRNMTTNGCVSLRVGPERARVGPERARVGIEPFGKFATTPKN